MLNFEFCGHHKQWIFCFEKEMCGSDRIYARFGGVGFGGGNRVCRKSCVLLTQVVEINVAYGISKATHWVHVHAKWL